MTTDKASATVRVSLCLGAAVLALPGAASARCGEKRVCRNLSVGFVRPEEVARYAHLAGFRRENLLIAVAVAGAESDGFRSQVECDNIDPDRTEPDGSPYVCSTDYGLWQANNNPENWFPACSFTKEDALDPQKAAQYAHCVSRGGLRWRMYAAYKDGSWREYTKVAREAIARFTSEARKRTPAKTMAPRQSARPASRVRHSTKISTSFLAAAPTSKLGIPPP
jgi:hypothetical protein